MKIMNRPEGFHPVAGRKAASRYHQPVSDLSLPAAAMPAPRQFGLRLKINLIVGALTLLFLGVLLTLQLRSIRESVKEETVAANRVAAQLLNRTAWRYAAQGMPSLMGFLQGLGRVRSNEIALVDERGELLYQSPPSAYKSGRDAPEWFAQLVLPQQSVQAIEFPGGKLEVRSNASRSVLDAWDAFVPLAGVGLGLLVLVNGLVFWVVGRTVRPFGRIVAALDELQAGRFDVALPPLPGTEAAAIGEAFNRMTGVLRQHIDTEKRAARAEEQLVDSRELTRWIDHHIEQERRMIARELHDELGQSVTAIRSLALSVAQRVRALDLQSEQAARLIAEESSRLYDAMHGLIPRLTPLVLDNFGLADALADLVERTRRSQPALTLGMQVELGAASLPSEVALALYRAAQEGITNALRHGQASEIWLSVRAETQAAHPGGIVRLRLQDNGVGLATPPPRSAGDLGHHGLRWLGERVESLQGRFRIGPAEPRGALLEVELPLPPAA
jgi:two-component system, NarL family, sensor histidine kinase UhpB